MKTYLAPEEIDTIEKAATNLRDKLRIHLLFRLGCRISEALSVKVEDIDFMQGQITMLHLKRRIKLSCSTCGARLGGNHVFCPGCGNKIEKKQGQELEQRRQRVLPIDQDTLSLLKEYLDRGGPVERNGKKMVFGINATEPGRS
jgi:integrase/recombinase XerD